MSAYLIHAANLLILSSFLVRDILWLRVLSIGAGLCFLPYFYFAQAAPLWAPIGWNLVFMTVNGVQIWRLYLERRPVQLSPDEAELRQLALHSLTPREVLQLVGLGSWKQAESERPLCSSGEPLAELLVLVAGQVRIEREGRALAELGPGRLIGEMSYLTGEAPTVDVRPLEPCRLFAWEIPRLKGYLETQPALRGAFQRVLGADLSRKLRGVTESQRLELG